ncbi:DDAH [Mytilus coruscus]|uniref:DDAH n=1 Tax=Mytilus coruscus TaxID=42192 RepID=A0A6J8BDV6_MYTCO|nr:DDAH [Mytilus coruscus]
MSNRYECNAFEYNFAILVRIPDSFQNSARKFDPEAEIDMEKARKEHKDLVETLKKCDVRTIELDGTEEYPECPFVDDCVVAIGNTALITRPGSKTRQGEVSEIRRYLQSQMKMTIVEIRDPDAIVEGGDVLFTGKEIFVGIGTGRRTNEKGAQAQMKSLAQYKYRILRLDSDDAANMLYVNGRLIHRSRDEIGEKSYSAIQDNLDHNGLHHEVVCKELTKSGGNLIRSVLLILDEKITYAKHKVGFEEISKTGGYLSSAVLLINRNKKPNSIVSNITREDTTNFSEWRSM